MRKTFAVAALCLAISCPSSYAAVGLDTYADAKGYIDVQKFKCSQLADTYQEDANLLTMWYSGWYNGLAKKHMVKLDRAKEAEHLVIEYCKSNPDKKVIQAIAVVFKQMKE